MSVRRSDRLIDMTRYFLERPHTLVTLSFFAERYASAKSSISEDMAIIKRTFANRGTGRLETIPGAAGGALFIPTIKKGEASEIIEDLIQQLSTADRILPGGYLYMSDLLSDPTVLKRVGRLIASEYADEKVDAIMTVETKGIPIAQSVANYLGVPFIIVRHDSKITEGSTISVNYVSGSSAQIKKMELSKRSLKAGTRVLVVDDYMKGGGTLKGMQALITEFEAELIGTTVFAEGSFTGHRMIDNVTSLLSVDANSDEIRIQPGNYLDKVFEQAD
ncbi:PurR: transcription regulator associated with purine metabolism [Pediococcus damnosus]|uniref:PurR: transcription regulator associated with purine metabolism n=1 Tax=Pediococcus damnosus TaxID=51663 RepID=A0A143ARC6_9LACO|nr:pur operon repressor [Pediococcus damnosus]AMV63356.1 PurR: transcription regulator associated with purine metabolism [Pediococcus damnosus]AMV66740.1 PurR: transcription regulator associated with purine metabolism [Pediococcus damnosus]AMV69893.1 PurR: transcription regulator associated with purine metabolism [Pediococcus damnosus]KJU74306.1 purine operon repressor [Pediococcus damnosus LMG 28219]PIO81595.1 pur operon repressor [Pediococcus damnosus]